MVFARRSAAGDSEIPFVVVIQYIDVEVFLYFIFRNKILKNEREISLHPTHSPIFHSGQCNERSDSILSYCSFDFASRFVLQLLLYKSYVKVFERLHDIKKINSPCDYSLAIIYLDKSIQNLAKIETFT